MCKGAVCKGAVCKGLQPENAMVLIYQLDKQWLVYLLKYELQ